MKLTTWNAEERVNIEEVQGVNKTTFKVYARLPNGKVVRQRFNTEAEAVARAEDLKIRGLNLAKAKTQNVRPTSLGATQEGDYITAMEILDKKFGEGTWNLTKQPLGWLLIRLKNLLRKLNPERPLICFWNGRKRKGLNQTT